MRTMRVGSSLLTTPAAVPVTVQVAHPADVVERAEARPGRRRTSCRRRSSAGASSRRRRPRSRRCRRSAPPARRATPASVIAGWRRGTAVPLVLDPQPVGVVHHEDAVVRIDRVVRRQVRVVELRVRPVAEDDDHVPVGDLDRRVEPDLGVDPDRRRTPGPPSAPRTRTAGAGRAARRRPRRGSTSSPGNRHFDGVTGAQFAARIASRHVVPPTSQAANVPVPVTFQILPFALDEQVQLAVRRRCRSAGRPGRGRPASVRHRSTRLPGCVEEHQLGRSAASGLPRRISPALGVEDARRRRGRRRRTCRAASGTSRPR